MEIAKVAESKKRLEDKSIPIVVIRREMDPRWRETDGVVSPKMAYRYRI